MLKFIAILASMLVFHLSGQSQNIVLKGTVGDSTENVNLKNAVIYLKQLNGAKLVDYTRADDNGAFEFVDIAPGHYLLVVSYPEYIDWIDSVMIDGHSSVNMQIFLMTRSHLLQEVIVKQNIAPIRIKGDTTEFLADSFKLRPGATVEELLRVLPGVSVNAKGQITADGQRVQKVLVDGDEFFGNDPTIATQNLNKSDILKVQVYDKKTDRAIITGIDDGVKEKTVNLVLKDDAKKGHFGELSSGSDFNKYYQSKATISRFTNSLKEGLLLLVDRTGKDVDNGDFGSIDRKNGISEIIQGVGMLNKKFGLLGSSTVNNFSYTHLQNACEAYTGIKYFLPDTIYYSNQYSANKSTIVDRSVSSQNTFKLDSATTMTTNFKYVDIDITNSVISSGNVLGSDNATYINSSNQSSLSNSNNNNVKLDLYLKKLLNKTGTKFFTFGTNLFNSHNSSQTFLYNKTQYYTGGIISGQQIIDQAKLNDNKTTTAQILASYVSPISKSVSLNMNYLFNYAYNNQDIRTYENRNGKYDSLNALYSNHYNYLATYHQGGATLTYTNKKITAKTGFSFQDITLTQTDEYSHLSKARSFVDVFPAAGFSWKYSKAGNLNLNYNGKTQQPTLEQLQPIQNNNDPLNIQIGNPDLRPAFFHNFSLDFSNFKQVSGRFIRTGASMTLTENDFSTISSIDWQGKRFFQTINVNGNYTFNAWMTYQKDLKFFNMNASVSPDISNRHYTNFINSKKNVTDILSFGPMLRINKTYTPSTPLDVQFQYMYQFNNSKSTVTSDMPSKYSIQSINLFITYIPTKEWVITSYLLCSIREKLSNNDINNNSVVWNASIEKRISKKENIAVILKMNDLLNQNIGFNRFINSTSVTENTYSTVQRYVMLSLRWKFTKNRNPGN